MNNSKIIERVLRIAVAGEFIGHGVFALQGKKLGLIGFISSPAQRPAWRQPC